MIGLLLDMGLPRRATEDLHAHGIDALHLGPLGHASLPDPEVVSLARHHGRTIVTLDKDFARLVATSGEKSPSVILLRMQNLDRAATVVVVCRVLAQCEEALAGGCIVSVTEDGIRVRRLPLNSSSRKQARKPRGSS